VNIEELGLILWRRRLTFVAVVAACVAAVVAATITLPKTYKATATLLVAGGTDLSEGLVFDAALGQRLTRTFSTLAGNPNVADEVRARLPEIDSRGELLSRMSFTPVEQTQLLQISAEASSPDEARRIADVYAAVFVERMQRRYEAGVAKATVSVAEPAALPGGPSKPNPPLYIGLGTLLSLVLAVGVVLVRERLDTRIRVSAEDNAILGQPIMARIPRIVRREGRIGREVADSFGVLKTNLDFFDERPARVVMVTSPGISEGKSTVAAHLALAAVAAHERVVLIEGDLRKPGLDTTVLAERAVRSPVGLSNYLAGAASEEAVLSTHPDHPDLAIIWSGLIPPNPTALLNSQRLKTLLESLRLDFDRIVIDTSPISVGADASVVASRVDGALFLIDERKTKRRAAQAGLNQLRNVNARLLGVVLNRSATAGGESYYYYGERPPEEVGRATDGEPSEAFS
jgi:capsular exopolysaccharide synthesis family protein